MFFYRYKVSEGHLNKYANWLHHKFLSGKTDKVATCGPNLYVHKIFDTPEKQWIYFLVDTSVKVEGKIKPTEQNPYVVGFCCLTKIPRWVGLETSMLYVSPFARGMGIATTLYDAIMKDGVIVISGYSHNQKSRRLWMRIIENSKYVSWAHDILNLDRYADVTIEDDTFQCDLKIYEDIKKIRRRRRQDVRFIVYNPRYVT